MARQHERRRSMVPRRVTAFASTPQYPWLFHAIISMTGVLFLARAIWR